MNKLLILTEAAADNAEVVEEAAFDLAEWLNTNPGVLAVILFCAGVVIAGLVTYFTRKKKGKK